MARSSEDTPTPRRHRRAAMTPEERENQLVGAAIDLAEKQIRMGTASAQVITYYLKQSSPREKAELEKVKQENELLKARVKQLASMERIEEMYSKALDAMKAYSGQTVDVDDDDR